NTQPTPDAEEAAPTPHESPLHIVHSLGHDEGSLSLTELRVLYTNLSNKRVKKLEKTIKTSKARRRAKIVVSEDEDASEDSSK
ncbi:hypothetical protein Tco_1060609, partial [Tanacetum coccineum]